MVESSKKNIPVENADKIEVLVEKIDVLSNKIEVSEAKINTILMFTAGQFVAVIALIITVLTSS